MFLTRLSEEQAIVIKIDHSLHWSVKCCGREVSCNEIEQACEKIANYDLMKSLLAKLRLYHPCSGIRFKDFNEVLYNNKETMITINGKLKKNERLLLIHVILHSYSYRGEYHPLKEL